MKYLNEEKMADIHLTVNFFYKLINLMNLTVENIFA